MSRGEFRGLRALRVATRCWLPTLRRLVGNSLVAGTGCVPTCYLSYFCVTCLNLEQHTLESGSNFI